jgi:hypothetical protein
MPPAWQAESHKAPGPWHLGGVVTVTRFVVSTLPKVVLCRLDFTRAFLSLNVLTQDPFGLLLQV